MNQYTFVVGPSYLAGASAIDGADEFNQFV